MKLADLLHIQSGVTAIIGSGGKTTLLRTLGEELSENHSVLLTTTTKIFPFEDVIWSDSLEDLMEQKRTHPLLCAGTLVPESGKLTASDIPLSKLAEVFDYIFVEADGSAGKPLKAHAAHEPVIPPEANQVICVIGVSGFGQPIADSVHRPELYAALAGVDRNSPATPETAAAVLRAEALHQRLLINQVETEMDLERAKQLAQLIACPVVAGSLHRREYFVCSY